MVKIIIIGAGISGLSTYLSLSKHLNPPLSASQHDIKIYEAYEVKRPDERPRADEERPPEATDADLDDQTIFSPQAIGGGIGISKNGLNVLARLDEGHDGAGLSMVDEMTRRGHPIDHWEISTARGFSIAKINMSPQDKRPQRAGEDTSFAINAMKPNAPITGQYQSVMILRRSCWEILCERVFQSNAAAPIVHKRATEVIIGDDAKPNLVKFQDGTEEEADLVIGADGIRSVLRKAMFTTPKSTMAPNDAADGSSKPSWFGGLAQWLPFLRKTPRPDGPTDLVTPHYEGLVGVGGFVPSSILQSAGLEPGVMTVVFGPNGFFGYGYVTSEETTASKATAASHKPPHLHNPGPLAGWWSTFSSSDAYPYHKRGDAGDPNGSTRLTGSHKPSDFDRSLAEAALIARHKSWKTPGVKSILSFISTEPKRGSASKALEASFPTYTTPELPHWSVNGRVVLVGDAAHALQPSSGQGACQALEDAEALALMLKHHLHPDRQALSSPPSTATAFRHALDAFEELRKPRLHAIYVRSQQMSRMKADMNPVEEWVMYFMIWMMSWFHDSYNEALLDYDLPHEAQKIIDRRGRSAGT